jgi:preprotein translocase SecF subunit
VSVLVLLGSWASLTYRTWRNPSSTLGVDFVGGVAMTVGSQERIDEDAIRAALDEAGIQVSNVQGQREMEAGGGEFVQINLSADPIDGKKPSDAVTDTLKAKFPQAGVTLLQEDLVGPQVGKELKMQAVWALLFAMVGIIAYVTWRFEFGFALGGIVAIVHDVLITVGIYSLLGRQLTLQTVAVLLTIVGYSINDTIVIFDRIREDIRVVKNRSFAEICNLSVNQTLARTILTNITVMIPVLLLLLLGGGAMNDFALALFIGLIVGTYSTVFIATPVVLAWHKGKTPELGNPTKSK